MYLCDALHNEERYDRSSKQGLFELKKGVRTDSDGVLHTTVTTVVTPKGQSYFINKFIPQCNLQAE